MTRTELLAKLAEHDMKVDAWHGGAGQFRDLYIGTGKPYEELILMKNLLISGGCVGVKIGHVTNPDHPDHGKAMIEIESYWVEGANWQPNRLIRHAESRKLLETISRPHGMLSESIQARDPGDPTTMMTYAIDELVPVTVRCEREGNVWVPTIVGEYDRCYIECSVCHRRYSARHTPEGVFTQFEADRPLTILP
jgi:hypothetical protein